MTLWHYGTVLDVSIAYSFLQTQRVAHLLFYNDDHKLSEFCLCVNKRKQISCFQKPNKRFKKNRKANKNKNTCTKQFN